MEDKTSSLWRTASVLGNYKTALGKEGDFGKVIDKDSAGGLVSGPFAESELRANYHQVLLNSLGAEMGDLAKPDVGTLVYAPHWGVTDAFFPQCNPQDLVLRMR